ncbi:MAG: DUF5606 domain-containing protein [Bacteroidales bacterium]|nr:DUF5606 domain-containing protein [Bacteroidales bacterium]
MDLSKILAISGKPGLFQLVTRTKNGAIVESLIDGKRMPVFQSDKISSLNEISMFTYDEDYPLRKVFSNMYVKENHQPVDDSIKNSSKDALFAYFGEVLPNIDTERVHTSDIKKAISWYNLLLSKDMIDDKADEEPAEEQEDTENKE